MITNFRRRKKVNNRFINPDVIKCPKCKSKNIYINTQVFLSMPKEYFKRVSKLTFRDKKVSITGVDWLNYEFVCRDCGKHFKESAIRNKNLYNKDNRHLCRLNINAPTYTEQNPDYISIFHKDYEERKKLKEENNKKHQENLDIKELK